MGPWLTTIGLLLDIVGVVILTRGDPIVTNEMSQDARRDTPWRWQHADA